MSEQDNQGRAGVIFALIAFGIWILFPFYWNELRDVDPMEILCHRILWSIPVLYIIMILNKSTGEIARVFRSPKMLLLLSLSTVVITINWGLYIWSVANDLILQASLGYFMNPLANVLAGLVVFREQLRKWQWVSVGLAVAGVVISVLYAGVFPWIGVVLAVSFGVYGAVRKLVDVDAVPGLCVETILLFPFATGYLIWLYMQGTLGFLHLDLKADALMLGAGFVTAMPLVAYVAASKRLPISTVGMLFYLVPSGLFVLATQYYGEEIHTGDIITFAFIWASLVIFTWERRYTARRNRAEIV
ncbi:EamA family transporter RarD [Curvivirga sp.]|uniref:EamA family transporter RarD n=1 Tax=Curvivirga sp. TaxID=2856848 RepID=UPI003B5B1559